MPNVGKFLASSDTILNWNRLFAVVTILIYFGRYKTYNPKKENQYDKGIILKIKQKSLKNEENQNEK